jgi:hypothetical protein
MLLHEPEGAVEPRFVSKARDPGHVAEAPPAEEEQGVAGKCTGEGCRIGLPGVEYSLVGKESGEDRSALALRYAAQKDRDEPIALDEQMDRLAHSALAVPDRSAQSCATPLASSRTSSRNATSSCWRSSSSFSCSAMISISALRFTS